MCGIAGFFANQGVLQSKNLISAIIQDQLTRGPDHQAVIEVSTQPNHLLFGHNRLSIIDLSEHGHQPMWDHTGRYCIVYNGEVYNYVELRNELLQKQYVFNSNSDTEVILNAFAEWGIDALNKFNGPFAFALFDKTTNQLWLARDRFGVKPLFYYCLQNEFYFASSTTVLARHFNLKPNLNYVAQGLKYLVYEDDSAISPYENLLALPAGCYLNISFKNSDLKLQLQRYYDLQANVAILREQLADLSFSNLLERLDIQLQQAVKYRLRSDVPVGVSLSGGLDSATVTAIANQQHKNLIGFSFAHPQARKSEGPIVDTLAKKLNLAIEYIWPSAQEMISALPKVLQAQDAPFASMSIVAQYLVYQKVQQTQVKVLLGGQGGDEGFMGYRKFQLFWLQELMQKKYYGASLKFFLQMIPLLIAETSQFKLYWQQRHRYLNKEKSSSSLNLSCASLALGRDKQDAIWQRQAHDITRYSLPTLLRYEDRNSMGNSIESRLPFMDYQIIELGLALPESIKLRQGYGKWPIREIMRGKIPENIRAARYKRGFDLSFSNLIAAGLGQKIRSSLNDHFTDIKHFLVANSSIENLFGDQQLIQTPARFAEAIALLWLGERVT